MSAQQRQMRRRAHMRCGCVRNDHCFWTLLTIKSVFEFYSSCTKNHPKLRLCFASKLRCRSVHNQQTYEISLSSRMRRQMRQMLRSNHHNVDQMWKERKNDSLSFPPFWLQLPVREKSVFAKSVLSYFLTCTHTLENKAPNSFSFTSLSSGAA